MYFIIFDHSRLLPSNSKIKVSHTPTKQVLIIVNSATITVVATTNIQKKKKTPFKKEIKIKSPSLDKLPDRTMPGKNQTIPVYEMLKNLSHKA